MLKIQTIPPAPRWLGLAGLLPQLACLAVILFGSEGWSWTAFAIAWAYAALIFSFLGGMWWGLAAAAAARGEEVAFPLWLTAVFPSLLALATFTPWIVGAPWPGPSLLVLGGAILLSALVDWQLRRITPPWWMSLRVMLSVGLGATTLAIAFAQ